MDYIKIGQKGLMNWQLMYIIHLLCIKKSLDGMCAYRNLTS